MNTATRVPEMMTGHPHHPRSLRHRWFEIFPQAVFDVCRQLKLRTTCTPDSRETPQNNKTPAEAGVLVGLTTIELVTSSLSGMRSNRLSYSPGRGETLSGRQPEPQPRLVRPATTKRFNWVKRALSDLFFQHRHPYATNDITNEVEDRRHQKAAPSWQPRETARSPAALKRITM